MEPPERPIENVGSPAAFDPAQIEFAVQQLRAEQNLLFGVVAGAVAGALGAAIWAVVTVFTGFQIGWMAIGIGFLVGIAVRVFGKGLDPLFGVIGGAISLVACLAGNLLAGCGTLAEQESIPFLEVLSQLNPAVAIDLLVAMFSPIDLLFYGFAVYEGYKLSFRQISDEELAARITGARGAPLG